MLLRFLLALSLAVTAGTALAERMLVATLRPPSDAGGHGGQLFEVDPRTAEKRLIGPILVDGTQPVGLTGMAFEPQSEVLLGITAGIIEGLRPTLVSIRSESGEARVIGRLTHPLTDIAFDPKGRLFGWTADTGQLALIDKRTGRVTPFGDAREPPAGGGFAVDPVGNAFVSAGSAAGTLDRVDLDSGATATGPAIVGAPYLSAIGAMAFSAAGDLYAVNSIRGTRVTSALLAIDRGTGETRLIGDLPEDSDAIAFTAQERRALPTARVAGWSGAVVIVLGAAAFFRRRRSARRRAQ